MYFGKIYPKMHKLPVRQAVWGSNSINFNYFPLLSIARIAFLEWSQSVKGILKMQQSISKSMVLITIIVMDLLTGMEFDLFVPSFPQLQSHFGLRHYCRLILLA